MSNVNDRESDDTLPPSASPPVIRRGEAELAIAQALHQVALSTANLEALAMAVARMLDLDAQS